jgi:4-hydroxy-3-polyprenylbenzoate decarboxylase
MPADSGRRSVAVAVTGASGAVYAVRTLAALLADGVHVELVVSDYGRRLLRDELGDRAAVERLLPYLVERYGGRVEAGTLTLHSNRDLGATIASGSHHCAGMAIVPCSMKTLAGVAHGLSRNLVERAADVMLKERRRLVIVPREAPMSLPQLRNMVLCAEAGAVILPAMPAFYQMPKTIDDLADFMAGKILGALGFEHALYPPWTGRPGESAPDGDRGPKPSSDALVGPRSRSGDTPRG